MTEGRQSSNLTVPKSDDWILIGSVVGAFGVRGEAKVELHTDFPRRFKGLKRAFLGPERRPVIVERSRLHKGRALVKFEGIDSPEQVNALRGQEVLVPRAEAVELPADHFYLSDLLHARVYTEDGSYIGQITDVLRTGSNDVWVVNEGADAVLVPAIKDAVARLDLEEGIVVVQRWVVEPQD